MIKVEERAIAKFSWSGLEGIWRSESDTAESFFPQVEKFRASSVKLFTEDYFSFGFLILPCWAENQQGLRDLCPKFRFTTTRQRKQFWFFGQKNTTPWLLLFLWADRHGPHGIWSGCKEWVWPNLQDISLSPSIVPPFSSHEISPISFPCNFLLLE